MNFRSILRLAQCGDKGCVNEVLNMYRPLLLKNAIVGGEFDCDLYQELSCTVLICIKRFLM